MTPTPASVTVPVLVATNEYVTTWPTDAIVVVGDDLVTTSAATVVAGRVRVAGGDEIGVPPGAVPVAVAVSASDP